MTKGKQFLCRERIKDNHHTFGPFKVQSEYSLWLRLHRNVKLFGYKDTPIKGAEARQCCKTH